MADIKIKITDTGHAVEYALKDRTSAAIALKDTISIFNELMVLYEVSSNPHMD